MKKYIIILTVILTAFQSFGQHSTESREKIKALKVAFLTQELKLSTEEAQKFWPIYNKHQEELNTLRNKGRSEIKKKIKEVGDLNNLDESEAKRFVLLKLDLDKKMVAEKEDFLSKVTSFLSYKKIIKLHLSERDFAKKLMHKYGKGKKDK
tara:strand:+ start:8622 stop:9074 length:453 start_codon:yes stop_codon:yes gene_type:complete